MAQRPIKNQNWQGRSFTTFGPKFRIDMANPQMGLNGSSVYDLYAVSDNGDISLIGLSEGGMMHVYNDNTIEIVGGEKSETTGVDIMITGKNGDICITAEKNGQVRIRASSIVIDADMDVTINAGNNLKLKAANKIDLQSNIANCDALAGNLAPQETTFMNKVLKGTYVSDLAAGILGKKL